MPREKSLPAVKNSDAITTWLKNRPVLRCLKCGSDEVRVVERAWWDLARCRCGEDWAVDSTKYQKPKGGFVAS